MQSSALRKKHKNSRTLSCHPERSRRGSRSVRELEVERWDVGGWIPACAGIQKEHNMRKGLLDILKGKFLVSGDAPKNWMFLLFASFLAALMISSSHNADKKVLEIAELNEEVRKLKSEFFEARSSVQQLKLESTLREVVAEKGLVPSQNPPKKIKVKSAE